MGNGDRLQEVDEGKIPAVLEVLKSDGDWPFSFLMHQMIKMSQDFKKLNYNTFKQKIYTVGANIENGTFVVLTSFKGSSAGITYVHVYTCGDETQDVAAALQGSELPWTTDNLIFDVVYGSVRPFVLATLKAKGPKYTEATGSIFWVNPEEDQSKLEERNPPADVTVMFLNEGHVKEINDKWPFKFLESENVIKDCILTSFGMGVVRKSDKKLLSHAVCNHAGALFILHTEPEEQRKGYATLLLSNIVRETTKRQRIPVAIIPNNYSTNPSTETLFKKFNFVPFIPIKYYAVTRT